MKNTLDIIGTIVGEYNVSTSLANRISDSGKWSSHFDDSALGQNNISTSVAHDSFIRNGRDFTYPTSGVKQSHFQNLEIAPLRKPSSLALLAYTYWNSTRWNARNQLASLTPTRVSCINRILDFDMETGTGLCRQLSTKTHGKSSDY